MVDCAGRGRWSASRSASICPGIAGDGDLRLIDPLGVRLAAAPRVGV